MKCVYFLLLLFSANSVFGEICSAGSLLESWYYNNEKVITVRDSGVVEEFDIVNVTKAEFEDGKYLRAKIKGDKLSIELTEEFKNYELKEHTLYIKDDFKIFCDNGEDTDSYEVSYNQKILEENNHPPLFNKEEYKYVLYRQIKKYFELTDLLPIEASDLDISAKVMEFSMEDNDDFEIEYYEHEFENKVTTARLSSKRTINAPYNKKFTITAKESVYENAKSTEVSLSIDILQTNETITFTKDKYTATIDGPIFKLDDPIRLKDGVDDDVITVLRSEYAEYFEVSIDHADKCIKIELTKALPVPRSMLSLNTSLVLDLDVSWKGLNVTTSINVKSPKEIGLLCKVEGLDLEQDHYENPKKINDTARGVVQIFNETLNVEGAHCKDPKYMSCKFDEGSVVIEVTEEFANYEDNDECNDWMTTTLVIECPYEDIEIEYKQKIIDINNHVPTFGEEKYEFIFYNQLPANFELNFLMPLTVKDADISTKNFELSIVAQTDFDVRICHKEQKSANWEMISQKKIDPGVHNYTVKVEDGNYVGSTVTVTVNIQEDQEQLKFTKEQYKADYKEKSITFQDESVALDNGIDDETEFLVVSEYEKYFKIHGDILDNKIVLECIDEIIAETDTTLTVMLEARWKGLRAHTNLIVDVPGQITTSTTPFPTEATNETQTTPPPTHSSEKPPPEEDFPQLTGFAGWLFNITIVQSVIFGVIIVSMCTMMFIAWKNFYYNV